MRNRSLGDKSFRIFNYAFLIVIALTMIVPFWNVLAESFSSNIGSMQPGILMWPRDFSLSGYTTVWQELDLWKPFENSVIVSVSGTLIHVFLSALAGYALAQPNLPWRKTITTFVLITMMIPFEGIMIPFYVTMQSLGLLNTLFALILAGSVSGFSIILMRNFFLSIPSDTIEAAVVDGANHFRIFWRICLPLAKAGLATVALLEFVGRWNNLLTTVLLINDASKETLQVALNGLVTSAANTSNGTLVTENVQMAGIVIAVLPLIVIYPFAQRYFVKGIFLGSAKE